jgi:hypothetical protein
VTGTGARASALNAAGLGSYVDDDCGKGGLVFDPEFPEVPSDFLRSELWKDCGSGTWEHAENIFVLESRALANCVS